MTEQYKPSQDRNELFRKAEKELQHPVKVYDLGEKFEGLDPDLSSITILDTTEAPGCHYGANNVFVPIIHDLEYGRIKSGSARVRVSPETAILIEPSTGNGWVAFSDAAERLGYEHVVVMPDGLPEVRYQHPEGREVQIIRTPKEEYVAGIPKLLQAKMSENRQRLREGKKIYVSPNHAVNRSEITARAMSVIGRQLLESIGEDHDPIRVVATMGNGSSVYAVGDYVKKHTANSKVVVTESLAYGVGYDWYARLNGLSSYKELFGIYPGNPNLMANFSAYGSNAPIGIDIPLQRRAIEGDLIDEYVLFSEDKVLESFKGLHPSGEHLKNALELSNYNQLPNVLYETYGNTTLANIAVARKYTNKGERVVAVAYDSRKNY